jgi:hypothetical protein
VRTRRSRFVAVVLAAVLGAALTSTVAGPAVAADPTLVSAASGRCLDVTGNVSTAGTTVDIWDCNNQSNQRWALTSAGELRTFGGTMCLDVDHSGTTPGTAVLIWTCNGQSNQKWSWGANGSLVGQQSGLCLDVNGGATANGTKAILWTCNGQSNQRWTQGGGSGSTLVVDAATSIRPVTRVGTNFLYGLSDSTTPAVSLVAPLKPTWFRQPPPGSQHRPNGVPNPVGDTIKVASTVQSVNGKILVDMADSFDGFPYNWTSWTDWNTRIDYMFTTLRAHPEVTSVAAWEPWNEPDWTWPSSAGPWTDGWARTVQRVKQNSPSAVILGPSESAWNVSRMRTFLTAAKASGTVPDVICWHELSGWQRVASDIAAYRALEKELGISARPISIDEYATPDEIDVPAQANHYVAAFERGGVRDAERAFWYEPGTLNGLLHNGSPTASYWMYKWYADQSGSIVKVTPTASQDGVAAYDPTTKRFSVVFGGESGTNTVRVTGLSGLGATAKVVVTSVPGSGRTSNVAGPTTVSTQTVAVTNGTVSVTVNSQSAAGAYNLVITPA